jgi:hypothetical protein
MAATDAFHLPSNKTVPIKCCNLTVIHMPALTQNPRFAAIKACSRQLKYSHNIYTLTGNHLMQEHECGQLKQYMFTLNTNKQKKKCSLLSKILCTATGWYCPPPSPCRLSPPIKQPIICATFLAPNNFCLNSMYAPQYSWLLHNIHPKPVWA